MLATLVTGLFAAFVGAHEVSHPADPCQPPAIRVESANLGALPGPDSPACHAARKAAEDRKAQELGATQKKEEKR